MSDQTFEDQYELSKGQPYALSEARSIIELCEPPLSIKSIEFIGQGEASCAYLVNNHYVFRIPKNEEASGTLKREVCLLPKLKSYLHVQIPDIQFWVSESTPFGKVCVGYEIILGAPLDRQLWRTLSDEYRRNIVDEIAVFLNELHSFPVESALSCHFEVDDNRRIYKKHENYFVDEIFPTLKCEERGMIKQLFGKYFADSDNFQYKPTLVHGDMSPPHILIDPAAGKLNGIIDFGDMIITDPDRDLIWLYDDFDWDFCEMLLQNNVSSTEPERLKTKLKLFRLCELTIFIREGIKEQNDTKTKVGWRFLREKIKEFA